MKLEWTVSGKLGETFETLSTRSVNSCREAYMEYFGQNALLNYRKWPFPRFCTLHPYQWRAQELWSVGADCESLGLTHRKVQLAIRKMMCPINRGVVKKLSNDWDGRSSQSLSAPRHHRLARSARKFWPKIPSTSLEMVLSGPTGYTGFPVIVWL